MLSRAYWLAAWVLRDRHPLRAGLCLRRSHRLAPADPPDLPAMLARAPRPSLRQLLASARR
jgi:hypothetical protein